MDVALWRRPGGGAVVVVSDEGPGLPDVLSFERGRSGNGSTGLGLDIVRRVATGAGGGVTLGRPPGGGTVISVELPAPA
jgi:signal transduction histidine kinase